MTEQTAEQTAETFDEDVETQQAEAAAVTETGGDKPADTAQDKDHASDAEGAAGRRSAKRRIDQLTAKYRQEQLRNEELAERLERLESRIGPDPGPPRPRADDFETTEEYEDALLSWNDDRREHARKQEQVGKRQEPEIPDSFKQHLPGFKVQVDALKENHPDAADLIFADDWECTDEMTEIIVSSDRGAELAYHLANNAAEAARIASLTPLQQARELTKIEASLPQAATQQKQSTSRAPAPVEPIRTGPTGETKPEDMPYPQWKKQREDALLKGNS